ncbi:hypothetical protein IF2G_05417 [Cordyceps javanica]|nr:hypothetical protein IF2G_05417 [Cordyceps javanica]
MTDNAKTRETDEAFPTPRELRGGASRPLPYLSPSCLAAQKMSTAPCDEPEECARASNVTRRLMDAGDVARLAQALAEFTIRTSQNEDIGTSDKRQATSLRTSQIRRCLYI